MLYTVGLHYLKKSAFTLLLSLILKVVAFAQPTVTIEQSGSDPTNNPPTFIATFSEAVDGFIDDSNLSFSGTAPGTLTALVSETVPVDGTTYSITVLGMTGSGTVIVDIDAGAATALAAPMDPSLASTSSDNEITFSASPDVTINQASGQSDPASSLPINFTVVFSEAVSGFTNDDDVTYGGTAPGILSGSVTEIAPNDGTTYNLAVSGVTGLGTITASLGAGAGLSTIGTNEPSGASTSLDNEVTLSVSAPTVTINQDAGQVDPTNSSPILFRVIFSEAVSGFTNDDEINFIGTAPGTLSGNVTEIAPNDGTTYQVSVSGMTGTGTVQLSLSAGAGTAIAGLNLPSGASTSTDNIVTYDDDNPIVTAPFSPADNQVDVSVTLNQLQIIFDENVQITSGSVDNDNDRIRIRINSSDELDIGKTSSNINIVGNTVTIDVSGFAFNSNETYNIRIGNDVFEDLAGNTYSGISDNTTWNFTTQGLGVSGPSESICIGPNYNDIGSITVSEAATNDFGSGSNQTFILSMPSGFELEPGSGSISTSGADISNASVAIGATSIIVFYDIDGSPNNPPDQFIISGLRARAPTGPGSGDILRTGGSAIQTGNATADANSHGDLTSNVSTLSFTNDATANTICSNETIDFTASATGATTYQLRVNGGVVQTNGSGNFTPVSGLNNGDLVSVNTTGGACDEYAEVTIMVNQTPVADAGGPQTVCALEEFTLGGIPTLSGPSSPPYTYSWTGPGGFVSSDPNPIVTAPDPGAFDQNFNYTVTVTDGNTCTSSADIVTIRVRNISQTVTIDLVDFNFADNDPPVDLVGTPAGGTFNGPGVSLKGDGITYQFDPAAAGSVNSPHDVLYTAQLSNSCFRTISEEFRVGSSASAILNLDPNYCENEGNTAFLELNPDLLNLLTSANFSFVGFESDFPAALSGSGANTRFSPSNALVFDPQDPANTTNQIFILISNNAAPAPVRWFPQAARVNEIPELFISGLNSGLSNPLEFCNENGMFELTGPFESGEWLIDNVINGNGITPGVNGTQAFFNPQQAGVGLHEVQYFYDPGTEGSTNQACSNQISIPIRVNGLPVIVFDPSSEVENLEEFCYDSPEQTISTITSPLGTGQFSGFGVLNTAPNTAVFNPQAAIDQIEFDTNLPVTTPQNVDISFSFTSSETECESTILRTVVVYPLPPASFNLSNGGELKLCYSDGDRIITPGQTNGELQIEYPDGSVFSQPLSNQTFTFNTQAQFDEAVLRGHNELDQADFIVTWNVENAIGAPNGPCTNSFTETIEITPLEPVAMAGIDDGDFYCSNSPDIRIELSPSGGQLRLNSAVVGSAGGTEFIFSPEVVGPGSYAFEYVVVTGEGCESTIGKTVEVIPSPEASFNVDPQCEGDTISFTALNGANTVQYRWNFGDGIGSSSQPDTVYKYNATGIFSVALAQRSSPEPISGLICISTDTVIVTVGSFPNIDFTFNDVCLDDITNFNSVSDISISDYRWDFGDGNTSILENPINDFNLTGNFNVQLIAETVNNCADTASKKVTIFPNLAPTEPAPYLMIDIDAGRGGWEDANSFGDASTIWEFGPPSGAVINSSDNAWVTNLTGNYAPNTQAFVNSPCFDLSSFERPVVSLDIWSDTQRESDGAVFQYSTDGGANWSTLGSIQDSEATGINWYNQSGITGSPGGQQLFGWSRQGDTDWSTARHALDDIPVALRDNVRFRVAFGSNGDTEFEGFAFKNVRIEERNKVVLLETFANASSTAVSNDLTTFNNFGSGSGELIKLQYHTSFPGEDFINSQNLADHNARAAFYGVNSVPATLLDGKISDDDLNTWLSVNFSRRTLATSPFRLNVTTTVDGTDLLVDGDILAISDVNDSSLVAHVALIERSITDPRIVGENGIDQYNFVLRQFIPSAAGIILSTRAISRDDTFSFSERVQLGSRFFFDLSELSVIVFLQNDQTKEIYQTTQINPSALPDLITNIDNIIDKGIYLFPNPANQRVTLNFNSPIRSDVPVIIYDQFGKTVFEESISSDMDKVEIDTRAFVPGLYHIQLQLSDGAVIRERLMVMH